MRIAQKLMGITAAATLGASAQTPGGTGLSLREAARYCSVNACAAWPRDWRCRCC